MGARVTVLGLGAMGTALAGTFVAAGHRTTVWNRTPGKADALVARGAVEATSAAGAVAASPLVVVCLTAYDAVREVLAPLAGALAGRTVVNLTSGPPKDAPETAARVERLGAAYLDGVVMATPSRIGDPASLILYGGSRQAFHDHRETLAALGDPVHLGTDPALSSVYDTALLGLMWATLTGWLHGAALLAEVTAAAYTEVAGKWMRTVGGFMNAYARQIDSGTYPGDEFPLQLHFMTMDILVRTSRARGVDSGLPELFEELAGRAIAAGHDGDSYARLIEYVRRGDRA